MLIYTSVVARIERTSDPGGAGLRESFVCESARRGGREFNTPNRRPSRAVRSCSRLLIAIILVCPVRTEAWQANRGAGSSQPATSQPSAVGDSAIPDESFPEVRFTTPPRTIADVTRLAEQLDVQLTATAATTQPATSQPTTQPNGDLEARLDGWRLEYWKSLQEFRAQVVELEKQVLALDALSQDAEVAKLTEAINELRSKTTDVSRLPIPDVITEEAVAEARAVYEQNNQIIDALSATLTQQEALLRDGFSNQRARIQEDIQQVQGRKESLESTLEVDLKGAGSDAEREVIRLRVRSAAVRVAALETARVVVELKEKRTQQELEQNKLRRDAMQPYVVALRERMNALIEARSRSRAERLRERLASGNLSPLRREYYRLELLCDENIAALQKDLANAIRDRFPNSAFQSWSSRFEREQRFWDEFSLSLSRRSSSEVLSAYRDAENELLRARQELKRLQSLLDLSFREDRELEIRARQALEEFGRIEAEFRRLAERETDEETIKMTQQVGRFRLDLRNAFDEMIKLEQEVIGRLRKGVELADKNVTLWEKGTSTLYWAHLITRGPTILDPDAFKAVGEELRAAWPAGIGGQLKSALEQARSRLEVVTLVDWLVLIFSELAILYCAFLLTRACFRIRCESIEEALNESQGEESASVPLFGRRFRFHTARVGVVAVPLLALSALGFAFTIAIDVVGMPERLIDTVSRLVAAVTIFVSAINAAFKAPKPRFRLIPCSSTIARHYRQFGYTLVILATLLVGAANILSALELAPTAAQQFRNWFSFFATVITLLFLIRRDTVLNVFPRAERGRLAGLVTFLRAAHPFLIVLFVLLIVMHPIGFRAMAVYITTGLALTIALILAAMVVYQLAKELIRWSARRIRELHASYAPAAAAGETGAAQKPAVQAGGAPAAEGPATASEFPPLARAALSVLRWALIAGVLVSSLSIWGIRPFEIKQLLDLELWRHGDQPVTLWRICGAALAIFIAVVLSRATRQTLESRFYPSHPTIDRGAQAAINTLLNYVLITLGVYIGLQTLRIDFGALAVLFGGLGLGIGLGLQPLIVNFISGLLMLFERHVKVGDQVMIGDKIGEVVKVSMRSTTVRTADGIHLIIPNGEFINQKVENWTLENRPIRGQVAVGVSYSADPKRVRELLLEIAFAEPKVRMDPPPDVHFTEFAPSSLNFILVAWFNNPAERWAGMLNMRYTIIERFREAGIEIPLPERTLRFDKGEPLEVRILPESAAGGASGAAAGAKPEPA